MSESTILQPTAGQTVVTTETGHRGHHQEHHDGNAWEKATLREALATGRDAVQSRERDSAVQAQAFASVVGDIKDTRFDLAGITRETGTAGALASAHTNERSDSHALGIHDRMAGYGSRTDDGFGRVHESISRLGSRSDDAFATVISDAAKNASAIGVQAQNNTAALSVQAQTFYGQSSVQAERIRSELGMLTATGFQQAGVERQNYANLASVQAERIAAAAQLQAQRDASAGVLLATQNQAALAAQIAKCCCEGELRTESLRAEMLRLATYRVVPPVGASTGGIFPAGA